MTSPNNSPASVELKSCPFCGSNTASVSDNGRGLIFHVRCDKCRAAGPGERCASDAIAAWNTRTPSPEPRDASERISGAVSRLCDLHKKMLDAVEAKRPYPVSIRLGSSDLDTVLNAAIELECAKAALSVCLATKSPSPASSREKTVVSEAVTQADRDAAAEITETIAELPDRTSPEDWPDAMLVTADELVLILQEAFARHRIAALSKALGEDE